MSKWHDLYKNDPRYKAWRAEVLDRDDHTCQSCGSTELVQADHIIALANGGEPFDPDNGQALCRDCNTDKADQVDNAPVRAETWINPKWAELADVLR